MQETGTQHQRPLVLVVDDDVGIRLLARKALEQEGFLVEEAENGARATTEFHRLRPDIVLMDILMPEMDGLTACSELRKSPGGQATPIILMAGLEDVESINQVYLVGATDFMYKPFNEVLLCHRLGYILRASRNLRRLQESQAKLARAQRIAQLGYWDWDVRSNQITVSEECGRLTGLKPDDRTSLESLLQVVHPDDRELFRDFLDKTLRSRERLNLNCRIISPDGTERIVHQQGETTCDETGEPLTVTGTLQDITQLKRFESEIHSLAYYDALTSLPNHVLFRERLSHALAFAKRHNHNLVLMFLDIDRFKRINDTLGLPVGDLLLKEVGKRLRHTVRGTDAVGRSSPETDSTARLGGDEFTILLTNLRYIQHAVKAARRILHAISQPMNLDGQEVIVTGSIGMVVYPVDGKDPDTLLKHAHTAMYHAKDQGRNNFQFYSKAMNASAFERLVLENQLRRSVTEHQLALHYQPKVDLREERIIGLEALLRWHHPDMGLLSPDMFLQVAEESGFICALDQWAIHQACRQIQQWRSKRASIVRVAVNLSNDQFRERDVTKMITSTLEDAGVDPQQLEIELTEGIVMQNVDLAIKKLNVLRALGVRISIDDFGSQYSSLTYLKRLPVDTLKIARSFVRDLPDNEDDVAIVRAIIALGHNLNMKVIAEGVENQEQLEFLLEHDCDQVQGYLFGLPASADETTRLLSDGKNLQLDLHEPSQLKMG